MIAMHNVCKTYLMGDAVIQALDHVTFSVDSENRIRIGNTEARVVFRQEQPGRGLVPPHHEKNPEAELRLRIFNRI